MIKPFLQWADHDEQCNRERERCDLAQTVPTVTSAAKLITKDTTIPLWRPPTVQSG